MRRYTQTLPPRRGGSRVHGRAPNSCAHCAVRGGGRPGARGSYRSVVRWSAKLDAPPPPRWGPRATTHATSEKRKVSESGKAIRPASRVPGNGRGEWLVGSDSFVSRIKSGHVYSWAMGVVRTVILADFAAGEQGLFEQLVEVECLFGRGLTLLEGMGTAGTLRNPTNVMSEGAKRALPRGKAREDRSVFRSFFAL